MSVHTYAASHHRTAESGYNNRNVLKAGAEAFAAAITKAFPKDRPLVLVAPPMSGAILAGATRVFLEHPTVRTINPTKPKQYRDSWYNGYLQNPAVIWIDDCFHMLRQIEAYLRTDSYIPDLCCVLAQTGSYSLEYTLTDCGDAVSPFDKVLSPDPFKKMADKGTLIYVANVHEDGPPVPFFV
jgi:hypothetical protein